MKNFEKTNKKLINKLENNEYFLNKEFNLIGLEFFKYLTSSVYGRLMNPEPINLEKNTLSKTLARIKVFDNHFKKTFQEFTFEDLNHFIMDFANGKIYKTKTINSKEGVKVVTSEQNYNPQNLIDYINDFKRFWKVYKEYCHMNRIPFDYNEFSWIFDLRVPKIKKLFEYYPYLYADDVFKLSNSMKTEEDKLRVLISVYLMGRPVEIEHLRRKDIELRHTTNDNETKSIHVTLPNIKKNSSFKVPVKLSEDIGISLIKFIEDNNLKNEDYIFKRKLPAFAKKLRLKSKFLFGDKDTLTVKDLRKIGLCIYEQAGYDRSDIERIGGWQANSKVLNHYFNRRGVDDTKESLNNQIIDAINPNSRQNALRLNKEVEKQKETIENMNKQIDEDRKIREKESIEHNKELEMLKELVLRSVLPNIKNTNELIENKNIIEKVYNLNLNKKQKD